MPSRKAKPDSPTARAKKIVPLLARAYGDAECALVHANAFELIVATILSAQCTDVRVNLVTPDLFKAYPDARALARADLAEVERLVRSTGFFRAKAKNLVGMASRLVERHGGEVPKDLDALTELPGVGRKTAHVVLGTAYGIASGVVVDTHVKRISKRLGLTKNTEPEAVERDLAEILPREEWINFSHRLIHHGRRVCDARRPRCDDCGLASVCPKIGLDEESEDS